MWKLAAVLVLAVLVVLGSTALAQNTTPPGKYMIYGAGTQSCGTWVTERKTRLGSPIAQALESWVLGFISGSGAVLAVVTEMQFKETNVDAINVWIDNHCQARPLENIATAVAALVIELRVSK